MQSNQKRWTIGMGGEKELKESVLSTQLDDDDDDDDLWFYFIFFISDEK